MTKFFEFLKKQPLVTAALTVVVAVLAIRLPQETYWMRCVLRILMCGTTLFFLYLVSGEKTLSQGDNQTGYVFKHLAGILILSVLAGGFGFVTTLKDSGVEDGVLLRTVTLFFMFLFACLFEELCFRAVLNDAIVRQFRNCKGVFVISAVVSCLVFGAVHVIGSPLTDGLAWAQAVLKALSCAVVGFAFLILYWKTRNVWAIGLVHGLYDFFSSLSLTLGAKAEIGAGNYVHGGEQGVASVVIFSVQLVITALITLGIWKKVGKTIDFEEMRKNW